MGQLTSDDYENIWLRIKERFLKHYGSPLIAILVLTASVCTALGYSLATNIVGPKSINMCSRPNSSRR